MKQKMSFVKNIKTNVVFPLTNALKKMRKDLVPCTRDGQLIMKANIEMPNLYNPFTDVIIPNTDENSVIPGLIPCRDADHAAEIKASLMGMNGDATQVTEQTVGGLQAPSETGGQQSGSELNAGETGSQLNPDEQANKLIADAQNEQETEFLNMLRSTDVSTFDKDQCKDFALEHFGEKLSKTNGEETLREKVQVMINSRLAEAAA